MLKEPDQQQIQQQIPSQKLPSLSSGFKKNTITLCVPSKRTNCVLHFINHFTVNASLTTQFDIVNANRFASPY